jgi:hypothetical protein
MIGPDKIHPVPATGGKVIADYFYGWITGAKDRCDASPK